MEHYSYIVDTKRMLTMPAARDNLAHLGLEKVITSGIVNVG